MTLYELSSLFGAEEICVLGPAACIRFSDHNVQRLLRVFVLSPF